MHRGEQISPPEVPPQMRFLLVRTGESMDVTPAAVLRFSGVKGVFVYSYIREIPNDDTSYRLDAATTKTVVPFISALPNIVLHSCWLGCLSRHGNNTKWTRHYHIRNDFIDDDLFDSRDAWIQNQLVETACNAYAKGNLSDNVVFHGLLHREPACRRYLGSNCDYCERICNSFPPAQVMKLANRSIPCIPLADRLDIVQRRDSAAYSSNLTTVLRRKIVPMRMLDLVVLCPRSTQM